MPARKVKVCMLTGDKLETVQKIAYLLGENASETEEMLNSIVEFYTLSKEK